MQEALKNYARAMQQGEAYDLQALLRLVQLWLANADTAAVNELMKALLPVRPFAALLVTAAQRQGTIWCSVHRCIIVV